MVVGQHRNLPGVPIAAADRLMGFARRRQRLDQRSLL
jgi:hypothetical protein